jgi:hypothetical protein
VSAELEILLSAELEMLLSAELEMLLSARLEKRPSGGVDRVEERCIRNLGPVYLA